MIDENPELTAKLKANPRFVEAPSIGRGFTVAAAQPPKRGPVRLRLSRAKGSRLQAHSQATNGLPAVKVDRTTMWGNRWEVGVHSDRVGRLIETVAEAVDAYRAEDHNVALVREKLRGKNLACWCKLDAPCHADVLLEIANQ